MNVIVNDEFKSIHGMVYGKYKEKNVKCFPQRRRKPRHHFVVSQWRFRKKVENRKMQKQAKN